jgi:hypothetical protein
MQWLSDAVTNSAQTQSLYGSSNNAEALASDPNTTIYFADTGGPMGNLNTILDFDDISWISPSLSGVNGARVFLLDNPALGNSSHQDILLVGITSPATNNDLQYFAFSGTGVVDSGVFQFSFKGNDGRQYTAMSYDVEGDNLKSDISIRIYDDADNYIGKFSILAGFQ